MSTQSNSNDTPSFDEFADDDWPGAMRPATWFLHHPDAGKRWQPSAGGALRGKPGGPGLSLGTAEPYGSPWQKSQLLWSESGFQWHAPSRATTKRGYQGRHSVQPAMPLSAPVVYEVAPAQPETSQPESRKRRRVATVVVPTAVVATVAAVSVVLLTGNGPGTTGIPQTIGMYSGQQLRGVFQQIDAVADDRDTIVTTGSQSSDGQVRQQFFVSTDGGASWRLAQLHGQPPLGHAATLIANGPAGWLAVGPHATWTSGNGLTWTLASVHGLPGGPVRVLTGTANGFLAGGTTAWVSRDGMTWTAVHLALAPGETLRAITSAASRGPDTLISATVADGATSYAGAWLSTDGGSSWARVTAPASGIVGFGSGPSRFLAVGTSGVAYFSQNGTDWQSAGPIDPAGGWSPTAVNGLVVTGQTTAGTTVAYSFAGGSWTPARLGAGSTLGPAVATGRTVVAAGATQASAVGQQGVLLEADRTGSARSVPLTAIPGAVVPELAVNDMATGADVQVAVGSANGYPAIWRRQSGGSWMLESSSELTSGQDQLGALTGVAHGPEGWLAVGSVMYASADGVAWRPVAGPADVTMTAAGPGGYVVACGGSAWWSPDLASWSQGGGIDGQVLAVAADAHGFVSVGSDDRSPAVWTTSDGRSWMAVALPVPAGASSAVLQQVASDGTRLAALGQATTPAGVVPFAEVSVNGGATWLQVPFASPGAGTSFTALVGGSDGFTAVGQYGSGMPAAWTSADGTVWVQSRLAGLGSGYRITALAPAGSPADSVVNAVGSVATAQSQGAFIMGLPSPSRPSPSR
jgi:hypothetical protein